MSRDGRIRPNFGIQIARGRSGRPTGFTITKDGEAIGRAGIVKGAPPVRLRGAFKPNLPIQPKEHPGDDIEEIADIEDVVPQKPLTKPPVKPAAVPPALPTKTAKSTPTEEEGDVQPSLAERMKQQIQSSLGKRRK